MAKYVKITKAKNLRFRLISVLYLLFISLSIIQIPIDWLHINPYYAQYLRLVTSKDAVSPELSKARDIVDKVDSLFVDFVGMDEVTKTLREPVSYSSTDQFFIISNNAEMLFTALESLREYYFKMGKNQIKRKEFERLFEADLKNGLSNGKLNIWAEWKFKHVPATVASTLLADIKLRLNLLNGAIELDSKKSEAVSMIKLAFNVDLLQLGDTAKFVIADKRNANVAVMYGDNVSKEYIWKADTLYFIPKSTGKYQLNFQSASGNENIEINVEPTTFIEEKGESIQFFHEGKTSQLKYQNIGNVGSATCNCAGADKITYKNGAVSFTPEKAGWCDFELFGKNGNRLLFDSVYVQELPFPIVLGVNVSANKISKSRLLQQGLLGLSASHPDMDNFNYNIVGMKATLVGLDEGIQSFQGASIPLKEGVLERVKYIQINEVTVETSVRNFTIKEPLIIEII